MTTMTTQSPAELDAEAARYDQQAREAEAAMWAARRESARCRATAAACRQRDTAAADLDAAEAGLASAEEAHREAEAAVREAQRRISAAQDEAAHAADALDWARERGDEPARLVELDALAASAARVGAHEQEALHRAEAALIPVARARGHARNLVRDRQQKLAEAERLAADPVYVDPASPAGGLALFMQGVAATAAPDLARLGLRR